MASPSAAASASPTREFRQHHQVLEPEVSKRHFRTAFRVHSKLEELYADSRISLAEYRAGMAFRTTLEMLARAGLRTSAWNGIARDKHCGVQGGLTPTEAQRHALARLRVIGNALGPSALELLVAHLVDDASWLALGRMLRIDRRRARRQTIKALKALAAI
jgi:hypothetical protein